MHSLQSMCQQARCSRLQAAQILQGQPWLLNPCSPKHAQLACSAPIPPLALHQHAPAHAAARQLDSPGCLHDCTNRQTLWERSTSLSNAAQWCCCPTVQAALAPRDPPRSRQRLWIP